MQISLGLNPLVADQSVEWAPNLVISTQITTAMGCQYGTDNLVMRPVV